MKDAPDTHNRAIGHIIAWALFIALLVGLTFGLNTLLEVQDSNKEFRTVCEFQGGNVQGDVCIKGNSIVLTQDQYKEQVK